MGQRSCRFNTHLVTASDIIKGPILYMLSIAQHMNNTYFKEQNNENPFDVLVIYSV